MNNINKVLKKQNKDINKILNDEKIGIHRREAVRQLTRVAQGTKYCDLVIRIPVMVTKTSELGYLKHQEQYINVDQIIKYAKSVDIGETIKLSKDGAKWYLE